MKKVITPILLIIMLLLAIPNATFAASSTNAECVSTEDNYLIYVEGMTDKSYQYAVSNRDDLSIDSVELDYVVASEDETGNYVAILEDSAKKYLYVKDGSELEVIEVDFANAITDKDLNKVGSLTETIETDNVEIEVKNETEGLVTHIEYVGGLKIYEAGDGTYYYIDAKLPSANYSRIKELITKMTEDSSLDMYEKVKISKEINSLYNQLIDEANAGSLWQAVENRTIKQREDAQKGDEYAVLIKKIDGAKETYDIKFLITDTKTVEKESEEVKKDVKSTSKLPVTFDTTVTLLSALAVVMVAIAIVFVLKKKAEKKEDK